MNNCGNNIVYSVSAYTNITNAYTNITNAWTLCTKEAFQEVIRHVFQEVVPPSHVSFLFLLLRGLHSKKCSVLRWR